MNKRANKKATLKDIAREADVSVATVSYIINNVNNQTISDDTRYRVLDIAKRLQYVPNLSARSLVKGRSRLLGLLINRHPNDGFWKDLYYGMLAQRLEEVCRQHGYHLLVSSIDSEEPNIDIMLERELDGVFLADVKRETFNHISRHFKEGVPLVIVDSIIDDPLFYKVIINYKAMFETIWKEANQPYSNRFLVLETYNNKELQQAIIEAADVPEDAIFVVTSSNRNELHTFLNKQATKHGVILNEFLAAMIASQLPSEKPLHYSVLCSSHCRDMLPADVYCLYADEQHNQSTLAAQLMLYLLNGDEQLKHKLFPEGNHAEYVYSY